MNSGPDGQVTRRTFLVNAACGVAAGGLAAWVEAAQSPATRPAKPLLPYGEFGRSRYPATLVSFGAILISERQGTRVLKAAIDSGVNLVHSSASYVNGKSIVAVGDLFKAERAYRDKVFLVLKSYTPEKESEIDDMFRILGTDHADAICTELHSAAPARLDAIRKQQDSLKKKGKLRHTGFVCHGDMNGVMRMVLEKAPDYFDVTLMSMSMVPVPGGRSEKADAKTQEFLKNLRELKAKGVGVMAMKSGARKAVEKGAGVFQPHVKALLDAGADTVLTSINTLEQVEMVKSLQLRSTAPTAEERKAAAEFHESRFGACLMCGDCAKACPAGVPVNDLMRVRLYHDEYGWRDHARAEFAALGPGVVSRLDRCGDCTRCADACPVGLANARTVRRVAALFA